MKLKTPHQIEKELHAIEKGEQRPWGAVSLLLDAIEKTGYWHRGADSFTDWLETNASRFGVKPATLWRLLAAGRFVSQVRDRLAEKGIPVPELWEVPNEVSPEGIELLAKLERVIPAGDFHLLANRVFAGEAKRSELRAAWQTYRPVLGGQTARGRGVPPPRLNLEDPEQYRSLMEATVLDTLRASGPSWTGHAKTKSYQVFLHVTPEGCRSPLGYLFSAVAVVQSMSGDVEYHAFKFPSFRMAGAVRNSCADEAAYCDFLWILSPPKGTPRNLTEPGGFPPFVGLVATVEGKVEVLRRAERAPNAGESRDKLVTALLIRSMKERCR